jgi:hypothetical protein
MKPTDPATIRATMRSSFPRRGASHGAVTRSTLASVRSPESAVTDSDPEVAATVRLLHRRRGWVWATVIGMVAWLTAAGLLGALAPSGSGAGAAVGSVFVVLLTVFAVVGLIASLVDTVRLHRLDAGLRERAGQRTAHHPARAHAYSYPPRHRYSWVFGWIVMLVLLGFGVPVLPGFVNGVAYLGGAESASVFLPVSYSQDCGRSGCSTVTDGVLANGAGVTWPGQVPLGQAFTVHTPLWDWGYGSGLIDGDGTAIGFIVAGVLLDGFAVLVLLALVRLVRRWIRHRRQSRQMVSSAWPPNR